MEDEIPLESRILISSDTPFPPVESALKEPNGLLAIGGELSVHRLLQAYKLGIFPWYSDDDPVLWWCPDPRMVLFPHELRISKSLAKRLRKDDYEVTFNRAFRDVMLGCARTLRKGEETGTWITEDILECYCQLHELGYAQSVETWINGELAGGLYGVKIGSIYYGESMFHRVTDASKIAFVHLVKQLREDRVKMIDCQMNTGHLASLGAREIPRTDFTMIMKQLLFS